MSIVLGSEPFGPLLFQAEADRELTLSTSPTAVVSEKTLFHGNWKTLTRFGENIPCYHFPILKYLKERDGMEVPLRINNV